MFHKAILFINLLCFFYKSFTLELKESDGFCTKDSCLPDGKAQMEKCRQELGRKTLSSLSGTVGMGCDNLQNIPLAMVLDLSYEQCSTTPEGKFLVPDEMNIYPIRKLKIDKMAKFYEYWHDYVTSKSLTINAEVGLLTPKIAFSGSFSSTTQDTKEEFISEKSSLLHSQIEYLAYKAVMQDQSKLQPAFKQRIHEINDALLQGFPLRATYLAELLIRDYGTHVITRVELGGRIEQEDYVESSVKNMTETHLWEMKVAATATFFQALSLGGGFSIKIKEETKEQLSRLTKHSQILTNGGPDVNRLLRQEENKTQIQIDELVVTDTAGVPLFTMINENTFPEYDHFAITKLTALLLTVTKHYYKANSVEGCMDSRAPDFDFRANVNGSCASDVHNQTFGGIYQTCRVIAANAGDSYVGSYDPALQQDFCRTLTQKNGITGDFLCPEFYEPVLLLHTNYTFDVKEPPKCWEKCSTFHGGFFTKKYNCRQYCNNNVYKYNAKVEAYYCRAKSNVVITKESGFLFGGLYSKDQVNLFTGSASCPGLYQSYHIFRDTIMCLSRNFAVDSMYEVQVERFFTCQSTNEDAKCKEGFTQHLATSENGCDVMYCVKPEKLRSYIRVMIKRPPFLNPSVLDVDTQNIIYFYRNNTFWHKQNMTMLIETAVENDKTRRLAKIGNVRLHHPGINADQFESFIQQEYVPDYNDIEKELFEKLHETDMKANGVSWRDFMIVIGIAIGTILVAIFVIVGIKKYRNRAMTVPYVEVS